jgi:hypothetical protein
MFRSGARCEVVGLARALHGEHAKGVSHMRRSHESENVSLRIAVGGVQMRGNTVLVTESGVVIRCSHPPPVAAILSLDLYLPGNPESIPVRAVVRQRVDDGWVAGFRAQFVDLDATVRSALAMCALHSARESGFGELTAKAV